MYTTHALQGHNQPPGPIAYSNHMPNGQPYHTNGAHHHQPPQNQPPSNHRSQAPAPSAKERITVQAVPSVTVQNGQLVVGNSQSSSTRSYTPLKLVGDGSFGTVWLCDWHGTLPPNTPMSAMQSSPAARPEYQGKRLVAVKRMKKTWDGGWDECKKLKELESLRAITYHPNIIPLYDFFLLPDTKELYFVFESMEGNLYQLIKTRKGKPLAGGLVSSIFRQVVMGLHHIHASGYFHRDMKPENLLVTTTGLYDYRPVYPHAAPDAPPESDVVVIVKLADFGLARETKSKPPYTEYVSTRWYRAPEVLLKSRDYSNPVDMWALGTIMAELVNLRPLFPGQGEVDQVARICELLGDPVESYGTDQRGMPIGGGKWPRGVKMARNVGFSFPKIPPRDIYSLFDRTVPVELVECIADLLKYDPDIRLTSQQCLDHPYLMKTTPLNNPPPPPGVAPQTTSNGRVPNGRAAHTHSSVSPARSLPSVTPRNIPPSHSHAGVSKPEFELSPPPAVPHIPDASSTHRTSFYDPQAPRPRAISETSRKAPSHPSAASEHSQTWTPYGSDSNWDAMDISEIPADGYSQPMDIQTSPMLQEHPSRPPVEDVIQQVHAPPPQNKLGKFGSLGFGRKTSKWGLGGMFGHGSDKHQLSSVQEMPINSAGSTPSLKRTQSSSTDSRSLSELSPIQEVPPPVILDPKLAKKEAARLQREADKQRRLMAEKMQKEQARAVIQKAKRIRDMDPSLAHDFEWRSVHQVLAPNENPKGKQPAAAGPIRQTHSHGSSPLLNAAGGSFASAGDPHRGDWRRDERMSKARRRDFDDDHSMSSADMPSGMSVISFATVDSDPGPARLRHRPSAMGISRMTSMSSLQANSLPEDSYGQGNGHGRSASSLALENQFTHDFHLRASMDSSSLSDHSGGGPGSPLAPSLHTLSLSSPIPWQRQDGSSSGTLDSGQMGAKRPQPPAMTLSLPPVPRHPAHFQPTGPGSPYEHSSAYPPSPMVAPKSAINPIFKVPPISTANYPAGSLPPFSHLEAVADGEYPPLSPMSFTNPEDNGSDYS